MTDPKHAEVPPAASRFAADLQRAADGDPAARQRLWADHYDTLHDCAKGWFERNWPRNRERPVSLDGTDIIHVAYERLHDRTAALANGKAWFFRAFYTECMRIVVDHYRRTRNEKGGGSHKRLELQTHFAAASGGEISFDLLYELLTELQAQDQRTGEIAMLKVLESRPVAGKPGQTRGLTNAEVADLLGVSLRTVEKDWAFAKAFLIRKIDAGEPA